MLFSELISIQSLVGKGVEFNAGIEDQEGYAENGMRATIMSVKKGGDDGDLCVIEFDFTQFDEYNKQFESSNYYDKKGNNKACLTAREAGYYKLHEKYYLYAGTNWDGDTDEVFSFLCDMNDIALLKEEFEKSGEASYMGWLESIALEKIKGQ
ncbi:hypothetical protein [Aeromonas veronii]|uniref:Uncharacterized protein n=1 Tax=Aeromonas veronii TaxID=654 RepID=A0A2T4MX00_AERVE|nr:hypothetical protein [Aeromonas veronii]PTH79108.1 hypothetical protein DAA48_21965 [Aeromonas veronii]